MKLNTTSIPVDISNNITGSIHNRIDYSDFSTLELINSEGEIFIISNSHKPLDGQKKQAYRIHDINVFNDNDIVLLTPQGNLQILYQSNSKHNALFFTDFCNHRCLMCSQPPKRKNDFEYFYKINREVIKLIPKECEVLGITGGEPTIIGKRFFEILNLINTELPKSIIHILTNGRIFKNVKNVFKINELKNSNIVFGIPFHSDYYQIHDYLVQSKNAFYDTMKALYNLARFNHRIEIRIILNKYTISRLFSLSKFIYKNLTFVEHIAFMGLENIGNAQHNFSLLYTKPEEYSTELEKSVLFLSTLGMNVSIYNLPYCFLPKNLWEFQRNSISEWKKYLDPMCKYCSRMIDCSGLFKTNIRQERSLINIIN